MAPTPTISFLHRVAGVRARKRRNWRVLLILSMWSSGVTAQSYARLSIRWANASWSRSGAACC